MQKSVFYFKWLGNAQEIQVESLYVYHFKAELLHRKYGENDRYVTSNK